jgi:hypothetical protein
VSGEPGLSSSVIPLCRRQEEPDGQISCIRLSDKTSRLRPRHVAPKPGQAYEPEMAKTFMVSVASVVKWSQRQRAGR